MTADPKSTAPTLFEVRGDLVLAALCIGQFHAPCQIGSDHLLVEASAALAEALRGLGLQLAPSFAPIQPVTLPAPPRRVVTHGAHSHDEDDEAETPHGPASNA